jgi:hypothetical protein
LAAASMLSMQKEKKKTPEIYIISKSILVILNWSDLSNFEGRIKSRDQEKLRVLETHTKALPWEIEI